MINGLGVLGWGVGGIEAEAAMLGQPVSMLIPKVVGFKLARRAACPGTTATDLDADGDRRCLRERGVVGMFVEFYGAGLATLPIADRATIGNMSPEFGSHLRDLPDRLRGTLGYLRLSGRSEEQIALLEAYAKEQGLWHDDAAEEPTFSDKIELDLPRAWNHRSLAQAAPGTACPPALRAGGLPRLARGLRERAAAAVRQPRRGRRRRPQRRRPGRGRRQKLPRLRPRRPTARPATARRPSRAAAPSLGLQRAHGHRRDGQHVERRPTPPQSRVTVQLDGHGELRARPRTTS